MPYAAALFFLVMGAFAFLLEAFASCLGAYRTATALGYELAVYSATAMAIVSAAKLLGLLTYHFAKPWPVRALAAVVTFGCAVMTGVASWYYMAPTYPPTPRIWIEAFGWTAGTLGNVQAASGALCMELMLMLSLPLYQLGEKGRSYQPG